MVQTILYLIARQLLWATALWGIKYVLKLIIGNHIRRNLEERVAVDVPFDNHSLLLGTPEKNISFRVNVTRGTVTTLQVIKIEYEILYDNKVVQCKTWVGCEEISGEHMQRRIDLVYYPMESPLGIPPFPNKWGIRGVATIDCLFGQFEKNFCNTKALTISHDGNWDDIREIFNAKT